MKKNFGSDKSISLILRIALTVLIICVGATFLHVYDIKNVFEKNTLKSYEGHVDTAVEEVKYQIDILKNIMNSFEKNMEGASLNEEINDVILRQEMYAKGYTFYYLAPNSVLVGSEENKYNDDLYKALQKISAYYYTENYVCLPAKNYFTDPEFCDSILGIKKLQDENGGDYYLIVKRDLSGILNIETFDYLNSMGCFAIIEGDGDVIAHSETFNKYLSGNNNIYNAIYAKSSKTNKAQNQINLIKKNIYSEISFSTKIDDENGDNLLVYAGEISNSHDMYYLYFFEAKTLNKMVQGVTIRSFIICLFMILVMVALIIFVWITLNESNDLIIKLAYIDEVTEGYNYNYFRRHVSQILQNNRETPYLMLRFDIMNFRYINESYGHDRADKVLMATVKQFEKVFDPQRELCVRVNSDQFVAIVINDIEFEEKYMRYLKGISDNANEAMIKYPIRLKMGMYQVRKEDQNVDLMIDRANAARKSVDVTSNNLTATYSDNIISNMRKVDAIESEMDKSLKNGEFKIYIQPKWDIVKDEIMGGEALVRWIKNDGSMVYPSDFIPIFESNGFIETLDFYMLEQLCIKMKEMRKEGKKYRFFPISVNQSRVLINNPDYVKNVEKTLKRYETDFSKIQLEITENLFFDQQDKMVDVVGQLKKLGLELAMDDFGSGYSSLNILKDVPFDILKIDKDFFDESIISKASSVILKKIFEMAEELDIDVICEGVETKEQVEMLKGFGCHAVQGYYYGKPMPCEEFIEKYCLIKE
ncbi:MAG: GGDEF domain-containing phosphodiesterase [Lachnospiraceae bacterium]|nr:GGDEF domain-containing phosphodiesterase [Lachnospiraceae bacterium]